MKKQLTVILLSALLLSGCASGRMGNPGAIMAGVEQFRLMLKVFRPMLPVLIWVWIRSWSLRPSSTIYNRLLLVRYRPFESAVLSVTHIEVGNTWNVLPAAGFFEGTIRTFEPKVREDVIARFEKSCSGDSGSVWCSS